MGIQLVLREIVETGPRHPTRVVAQHTLEEALKKTHRKGSPPKPRRTVGIVAMIDPRSLRQTVLGVIPKLRHPRHPLDTAPKGVETHPGDGRLSVGNASMLLSHIYHAWLPHPPKLPIIFRERRASGPKPARSRDDPPPRFEHSRPDCDPPHSATDATSIPIAESSSAIASCGPT